MDQLIFNPYPIIMNWMKNWINKQQHEPLTAYTYTWQGIGEIKPCASLDFSAWLTGMCYKIATFG
jgi:hypothetical protein